MTTMIGSSPMRDDARVISTALPVERSRYHRLRVREIVEETADARSIIFDTPANVGKFGYKPGQFLTLRLPGKDGAEIARCYSLSSAPKVDGHLMVTVKRVEGGLASNWLCDNLHEGDELDVLPPAGHFTPHVLNENMILFAGGSGITPILSILKAALGGGTGKLVLIYANRDEKSVIFRDEINSLARKHPERMTVIHWLESVQGLPGTEYLAGLAGHYPDYEVFICGPEKYMDCAAAAMASLGVDHRRVHSERFVSLSDAPVEVIAPIANGPDDDSSASTELGVLLDGQTRTLVWPSNNSLLSTLLTAGIDAPYSCNEGKCSACICKLLNGSVEMAHNQVLDAADLEEGWVLACQSVPTSDHVFVSFDE